MQLRDLLLKRGRWNRTRYRCDAIAPVQNVTVPRSWKDGDRKALGDDFERERDRKALGKFMQRDAAVPGDNTRRVSQHLKATTGDIKHLEFSVCFFIS